MSMLEVYNTDGKKVSELEAVKSLFDGPVRKTLIWEAIKMHQANLRKGTASTKTRSFVRGSTRKIYRQKGTGNARHGDIKAPIFVGGGRVWGPHPRDYSYRIPRTARKSAIKSVLALKLKEKNLKIIENFPLKEIKTKKALEFFNNLDTTNALLIIEAKNPVIEKSIRNLPHYKVTSIDGINVYDLLKYDQLILTKEALKKIEEKLQ